MLEQLLILEHDTELNQGLCKALKAENRQIFSCRNMKSAGEQLLCGNVMICAYGWGKCDASGGTVFVRMRQIAQKKGLLQKRKILQQPSFSV